MPHPSGQPLAGLNELAELLRAGRVLVLTGAGISTESGIPDYRGPTAARRRSSPMTYQEFTGSSAARQRYWARSHVGWRAIVRARPNDGHRAVAALGRLGLLAGLVTQNVDRLHQAAGSTGVVDLHGRLDRVVCLGCGDRSPREVLDHRLRLANADLEDGAGHVLRMNPDGDVELPDDVVARFRTVDCTACAGMLKPDVVFFGENVPRDRVDRCYGLVESAAALLVLGSSLTVMSGLRFVRRAADRGLPVAIVNQGATRGDEHATLRLDAALGTTLARLVAVLATPPSADVGLQEVHGA